MDRDTDREGLRFPLRFNLIGIDCNSWGLSHIHTHSLSLTLSLTHIQFYKHSTAYVETTFTSENNSMKWSVGESDRQTNMFLTCLDWLKSRTRWPCLNHRRSSDSTTISFPERFQKPKCSSSVSWSSGIPLNIRGPPEKRSGWLQILRSAIKPENT